MWQIILPEVKLDKVRLLVVNDIIIVLFVSAEVDVNVDVARHSPAMIACHTVAHGNDGVGKENVEHGDEKDAEVSCPRNFPLGREASSFGMQRSPAAVAR